LKSHMYNEIHEQPEVLATILEEEWGRVASAAQTLRSRGFRFAMLTARGTSDNAAIYAKYLFEVLLGIPTALASPSTFTLYEGRMNLDDVLVVGISQSGESQDILETVSRTRELGASTLAITNDDESSMARAAEIHFSLHAGKEQSVAATKTYTAQLLLLYLLVAALKEEEPGADVRRLPDQARSVLAEGRWENTARYRYAEHIVVSSRGYNFATAREAALKLMEATYVVAQGFSAADLRHGPIAMIGYDFPVVAVVPPGRARSGIGALVEELANRGAELVVIAEDSAIVDKGAAGFRVPVSCPEELSPILYALPAQMLAHDLALLKGLNPDAPRGLSKVTETW
jgi:glucosamine--fructose-6-phosphate aminotransferase (isomerizing)